MTLNRNFTIFAILLTIMLLRWPAMAFYGTQSTEAMLSFQTQVDVLWSDKGTQIRKLPTAAELNGDGSKRNKAIELAEAQIQHLMGTFQSASFIKKFKVAGVLGEQANYNSSSYKQKNFDIQFTKVEAGTDAGRLLLTYKFKGKTVFDKKAFKKSDISDVPLRLPLSPDLIYSQSLGTKAGEDFNYCTDEHYNSEGDFWYFWDTQLEKCPLSKDDKLVLNFNGQLKQLVNSEERYPDYKSLYGANGNGKTLEISILLGYVDDIPNNKIGHTKDTTYKNFKTIVQTLKDQGFEMLQDAEHYKDNFRITSGGNETSGANFLREFVSSIRTKNNQDVDVHIKILLADTAIDSRDNTFHAFLVPAFENSDVLIYDGHSGLGANLSLELIPKVTFKPKKYQVFFFNGCSSYSYYNGMFFDAKKGSKYLDIVNSGLETSSDSTASNALAFMKYMIKGDLKSYKTIMADLEKSNGDNGTYLTSVSGENDNSFKPSSDK